MLRSVGDDVDRGEQGGAGSHALPGSRVLTQPQLLSPVLEVSPTVEDEVPWSLLALVVVGAGSDELPSSLALAPVLAGPVVGSGPVATGSLPVVVSGAPVVVAMPVVSCVSVVLEAPVVSPPVFPGCG